MKIVPTLDGNIRVSIQQFTNQFYVCLNGLQRIFGQCIRLNVDVGEELHDFIQHRFLGLPIGSAYLAAMEYGAQFRHSGEDFICANFLLATNETIFGYCQHG
uniref:Uncharacterized protein n=1 Tax=Glossina pallidipes TaxID=7398 RepID=A0A1A9Z4C0_GLOPL